MQRISFQTWLTESNDDYERTEAFEKYAQAITDLYKRYGITVHKDYLDGERRNFMTMSIADLRQEIANLPRFLINQERNLEREKRENEKKAKRDKEALIIKGNEYYRAEDIYERVVCSKGDPGYDKKGMKAYPMKEIYPELNGYYGVHVGSNWLPILKRDGYCDDGDAYIYIIHADEMNDDGINIYEMDDPHVSYRDSQTPDSQIIFFKLKVIPAKYIEISKIIPEIEIKEAPPAYGMED